MAGYNARVIQQYLDAIQHLYRMVKRHQNSPVLVLVICCRNTSCEDPYGFIYDTAKHGSSQPSNGVGLSY